MILSFKEQFVDKIKQGQKVTTIRKSGRWTDGRKIHFWKGSPRNPKSNPFHFGMGEVKDVNPIKINFTNGSFYIEVDYNNTNDFEPYYALSKDKKEILAKNEGFESIDEMKEWFRVSLQKEIKAGETIFEMDLIHFTFEELKKCMN